MKLIDSKVEILSNFNEWDCLKMLEQCARTCYKSEDKITANDLTSAKKLVGVLLSRNHEAMLEHYLVTVRFTCSRAISHEIVRHRMASFAQVSQRYVNYSKDKFGGEIAFIKPLWYDDNLVAQTHKPNLTDSQRDTLDAIGLFKTICEKSEAVYMSLIKNNLKPEQARDVLPNATATEIVMTANIREWRHFFKLRCAKSAHPEMQKLANNLLGQFTRICPLLFEDITANL